MGGPRHIEGLEIYFFSVLFLNRLLHGEASDGSCQEDGRAGTEYNTEDHGECEALDGVTTDEEDAEEHDESTYRGVDGTGQSAVQ